MSKACISPKHKRGYCKANHAYYQLVRVILIREQECDEDTDACNSKVKPDLPINRLRATDYKPFELVDSLQTILVVDPLHNEDKHVVISLREDSRAKIAVSIVWLKETCECDYLFYTYVCKERPGGRDDQPSLLVTALIVVAESIWQPTLIVRSCTKITERLYVLLQEAFFVINYKVIFLVLSQQKDPD